MRCVCHILALGPRRLLHPVQRQSEGVKRMERPGLGKGGAFCRWPFNGPRRQASQARRTPGMRPPVLPAARLPLTGLGQPTASAGLLSGAGLSTRPAAAAGLRRHERAPEAPFALLECLRKLARAFFASRGLSQRIGGSGEAPLRWPLSLSGLLGRSPNPGAPVPCCRKALGAEWSLRREVATLLAESGEPPGRSCHRRGA
jgi:hypothetical protein